MARRTSSERLIGRAAELATVDALLNRLGAPGPGAGASRPSRGGPGCLLIGGEAGIGKTRLVTELAEIARSRGYGVAVGGCVEHGAEILPLHAVDSLRESLEHAGLARAPDEPADIGGREPARLFRLVERLLKDAAADRPMVAVFEDLHWADASTRDMLTVLVPRVSAEQILVVGTYRTDELHQQHPLLQLLASLERSVRTERIELGPLSRSEVAALAAEILEVTPDDATVDALYARTSGSPFFVEELLAGRIESGGVPESLRQVVLARCQTLRNRAANTTLEAAAILHTPVDDTVLRDTSGLPPVEYEAALDALAERHLLIGDHAGRTFRHALVREVIADELPPGRRSHLHRRAADALAAYRPHQVGEIARHRLAAGDLPAALEAQVAAGRKALAMGAAAEAAGDLVRALELWEQVPDAPERAGVGLGELLRLAATASARGRQLDRAVALGRRAAAVTEQEEPAAAGAAWHELSVYLYHSNDPGLVAALERARELTPRDPPTALSAHIDHDRSYHVADPGLATRLATDALDTARRAGSPGVIAVVLSGLAQQRAERGDPSGVDELKAAIEAARNEPDFTDVANAVVNLTYCLGMLGRDEETPPIFDAWIDRLVEHGLDGTADIALRVNTLDAYEVMGEWDRVQHMVDDVFASYDEASLRWISNGFTTNWGQVLLGRGEHELASSLFLRARGEFRGSHYKGCWGGLLAGLAELGGRGVIAPIDDDEITDILRHTLPGDAIAAARAVATLCRFRVDRRSGPPAIARARGWLAMVDAAVAQHWVSVPAALATWLDQARAELAEAAGDAPHPPWDAIAQRWAQLRRPYPEAYARYRQADADLRAPSARSRSSREAATESLRRAREIATALGAVPLLTDVGELARRARLDLSAPAQPVAPAPYRLTERELDVLALVAQGRTDREIAAELFISRKTASLHVSSILRKVGATNRVGAAAIAGDLATRWRRQR